jgi:hypothetical protein
VPTGAAARPAAERGARGREQEGSPPTRLLAPDGGRRPSEGSAGLAPAPVPGWADPAEEEDRLGALAADLRRILVAEALRHGIAT